MDKRIEDLLREEIENQIEELSTLQSGSEEKLRATKGLTELYKLKIDEDKACNDAEDKVKSRIRDAGMNEIQHMEQKKERYTKIGIAAAELIIPLIFYGVWMNKGLQFEKEGTFTSTTFRGLFNRFRPTK